MKTKMNRNKKPVEHRDVVLRNKNLDFKMHMGVTRSAHIQPLAMTRNTCVSALAHQSKEVSRRHVDSTCCGSRKNIELRNPSIYHSVVQVSSVKQPSCVTTSHVPTAHECNNRNRGQDNARGPLALQCSNISAPQVFGM